MKKLAIVMLFALQLFSGSFNYNLEPIKLTENSYYFYGKEEYFSEENGGDIANSAFIIAKDFVVVIDTGSSHEYGEQMIKAIKKITNKPVKYVINTHHHPDHFLGNSAFKNAEIFSTHYTQKDIAQNGKFYIENLTNLCKGAMTNTEIKAPTTTLSKKELDLGGYKLEVLLFHGHTKSDVVIFDKKTKILYTSDLIFNKRALATPHANLIEWKNSLKQLEKIDFKILVPGHGKVAFNKKPIEENIEYLQFVDNFFKKSATFGLDIFEILNQKIPQSMKRYSMFEEEFERTVINLYPKYEEANQK